MYLATKLLLLSTTAFAFPGVPFYCRRFKGDCSARRDSICCKARNSEIENSSTQESISKEPLQKVENSTESIISTNSVVEEVGVAQDETKENLISVSAPTARPAPRFCKLLKFDCKKRSNPLCCKNYGNTYRKQPTLAKEEKTVATDNETVSNNSLTTNVETTTELSKVKDNKKALEISSNNKFNTQKRTNQNKRTSSLFGKRPNLFGSRKSPLCKIVNCDKARNKKHKCCKDVKETTLVSKIEKNEKESKSEDISSENKNKIVKTTTGQEETKSSTTTEKSSLIKVNNNELGNISVHHTELIGHSKNISEKMTESENITTNNIQNPFEIEKPTPNYSELSTPITKGENLIDKNASTEKAKEHIRENQSVKDTKQGKNELVHGKVDNVKEEIAINIIPLVNGKRLSNASIDVNEQTNEKEESTKSSRLTDETTLEFEMVEEQTEEPKEIFQFMKQGNYEQESDIENKVYDMENGLNVKKQKNYHQADQSKNKIGQFMGENNKIQEGITKNQSDEFNTTSVITKVDREYKDEALSIEKNPQTTNLNTSKFTNDSDLSLLDSIMSQLLNINMSQAIHFTNDTTGEVETDWENESGSDHTDDITSEDSIVVPYTTQGYTFDDETTTYMTSQLDEDITTDAGDRQQFSYEKKLGSENETSLFDSIMSQLLSFDLSSFETQNKEKTNDTLKTESDEIITTTIPNLDMYKYRIEEETTIGPIDYENNENVWDDEENFDSLTSQSSVMAYLNPVVTFKDNSKSREELMNKKSYGLFDGGTINLGDDAEFGDTELLSQGSSNHVYITKKDTPYPGNQIHDIDEKHSKYTVITLPGYSNLRQPMVLQYPGKVTATITRVSKSYSWH